MRSDLEVRGEGPARGAVGAYSTIWRFLLRTLSMGVLPLSKYLDLSPVQDAMAMALNRDFDLKSARTAADAGKLRILKDFSRCHAPAHAVMEKVVS